MPWFIGFHPCENIKILPLNVLLTEIATIPDSWAGSQVNFMIVV
jgi:hypothetical protein